MAGFNWLLALSGLSYFFVWGSCCLAHIRFRLAWRQRGYDLRRIPYRPPLGIWGSAIGLALNLLCLIATFYNSLYVRVLPLPLFFLSCLTYTSTSYLIHAPHHHQTLLIPPFLYSRFLFSSIVKMSQCDSLLLTGSHAYP